MTTKTAWRHLPNAAHIVRILASVKAHPATWAWQAAARVKYAAWDAARNDAWDAARAAIRNAAWDEAGYAARGAIAALVAWDDCAHYLDMTGDELAVWAELSGKPAAILLLPAVRAFERIETLVDA